MKNTHKSQTVCSAYPACMSLEFDDGDCTSCYGYAVSLASLTDKKAPVVTEITTYAYVNGHRMAVARELISSAASERSIHSAASEQNKEVNAASERSRPVVVDDDKKRVISKGDNTRPSGKKNAKKSNAGAFGQSARDEKRKGTRQGNGYCYLSLFENASRAIIKETNDGFIPFEDLAELFNRYRYFSGKDRFIMRAMNQEFTLFHVLKSRKKDAMTARDWSRKILAGDIADWIPPDALVGGRKNSGEAGFSRKAVGRQNLLIKTPDTKINGGLQLRHEELLADMRVSSAVFTSYAIKLAPDKPPYLSALSSLFQTTKFEQVSASFQTMLTQAYGGTFAMGLSRGMPFSIGKDGSCSASFQDILSLNVHVHCAAHQSKTMSFSVDDVFVNGARVDDAESYYLVVGAQVLPHETPIDMIGRIFLRYRVRVDGPTLINKKSPTSVEEWVEASE